jgi:hypothetical protein
MKAMAFVVVLSMVLISTAAFAGEPANQAERNGASQAAKAERSTSRTVTTNKSGISFIRETGSQGSKAEVPGLMSFSGTLVDTNGVALDTTISMTFSIYTDSIGGTQVWTETQPSVEVTNGLYNVLLGRVNGIDDTVFQDPTRWFGLQVGTDEEMTPRERLGSVAYAFRAAEADTADYARSGGGGGGGGWVDDGTVVRLEAEDDSVGIGTTTPAAKLEVQGTLNVGQDSSGYDVNLYGGGGLYGGARFFWDEDKMALRAGRDTDGTHWAPDSIGYLSLAIGDDTKASGFYSIAMGGYTTASGNDATAIGLWTRASGDGATALGGYTIASGSCATAMGLSTRASGYNSTAMGERAIASGWASAAIGQRVQAGPAFYTMVLGRGTAGGDTLVNDIENSLMIGFNSDIPTLFVGPSSGVGTTGDVGIGTSSPDGKLHVVGNAKVDSILLVSRIQPSEGTLNIGEDNWGYDVNLYGANPGSRFFWDEDKMALRAGMDTDGSYWDPDSVGSYSLATGYNTKARGSASTAMGSYTKASGSGGATAMGRSTTASGSDGATAMGYWTTASGDSGATAMGNYTTASGSVGATAMGNRTDASGNFGATAMGNQPTASGNYGATALGDRTTASGDFGATALGSFTTAMGDYGSIAIGRYVTA